MIANYHTHTTRCGHASGGDEEYVLSAVNAGLKILGMSDHGPCRFPDGFESGYRVKVAQIEDYFSTFRALGEKYADRLELHIGFELEYYPEHYESMMERVRKAGTEYLILGQHAIYNERPGMMMSAMPWDDPEKLRRYVWEVCEAMRTGSFTYVCHPEVFHFTGPEEQYLELMRPICTVAHETGTPLEINFLGIRDGRYYPKEGFWKMAGEEHADVVFGSDAHSPDVVYDPASFAVAEGWVKKYGLHLLETVEFRKP